MLENSGKNWEMLGNIGKLGNVGKYWKILGNVGKYWEILGNAGKYWKILRNTGKRQGASEASTRYRRGAAEILGNVRKYWEIWEMLENTGKYWEMQGNIGKYWEILGSDKVRAKRAPDTAARAGVRSAPANASR